MNEKERRKYTGGAQWLGRKVRWGAEAGRRVVVVRVRKGSEKGEKAELEGVSLADFPVVLGIVILRLPAVNWGGAAGITFSIVPRSFCKRIAPKRGSLVSSFSSSAL